MPEGSPYNLVLGGGQAIPGVEELIMELTPGETKERVGEVAGRLPRRGAARHRRRPCACTLQEVKRKSLPALDDAFAREVGDFDSLDALQHGGAQGSRGAREARRRCRACASSCSTRSSQANPFDVPPSWVNQLIDAYMQAYQIPEEQREQFAREFRPVAERQVRRDMIIDTIAEQRAARRRRRRTSTIASRRSPSSAAPIRARCTRRCRRPAGCRRSSAASPKRRCSSG